MFFVLILASLIYPIQAHWTWGGSLTAEGYFLEGFSDFAGSSIVHSVGGWAALAGVILLGPRIGKYDNKGRLKTNYRFFNAISNSRDIYIMDGMVWV